MGTPPSSGWRTAFPPWVDHRSPPFSNDYNICADHAAKKAARLVARPPASEDEPSRGAQGDKVVNGDKVTEVTVAPLWQPSVLSPFAALSPCHLVIF